MYCCTLLYVHSSIAIILMGKRELIALLNLSSWCLVMVERLFLTVPRGCLQFVIVVFPDHTHLLFWSNFQRTFHFNSANAMANTPNYQDLYLIYNLRISLFVNFVELKRYMNVIKETDIIWIYWDSYEPNHNIYCYQGDPCLKTFIGGHVSDANLWLDSHNGWFSSSGCFWIMSAFLFVTLW